MSNPIFIIGYMAAGKTTLGRYAAREMGRGFIDLDRYIEARYRKALPIFSLPMERLAFVR